MKFTTTLIAGFALAISAFSANAIQITTGGGDHQGADNVLFNEPGLDGSGFTVEGSVNGAVIDFTSTTSLVTPANGAARIEAGTGTFTNLLIDPEGPATFTILQFNVNSTATNRNPSTIFFSIDGVPVAQSYSLGNGQNRFTFEAEGLETMSTVSFTTTGPPVQDVRQVRIGLTTAVPDGGFTLGLLGCALMGIGVIRKKLA
ncbi:MAG: motif [Verrucomicrobiales bacterium]|nr:motif [Verrucomicrobiales bacterium]